MSVSIKELDPKGLAWELKEEHSDSLTINKGLNINN